MKTLKVLIIFPPRNFNYLSVNQKKKLAIKYSIRIDSSFLISNNFIKKTLENNKINKVWDSQYVK